MREKGLRNKEGRRPGCFRAEDFVRGPEDRSRMQHSHQEPSYTGSSKRAALLTAVTAAFLTPFMGSSVNLALPLIGNEFEIDAVLLSWVSAAYLLSSAMFLVPVGRLADIHGRKKVFLYGLTLFTSCSLLCGFAPSAHALIIIRFVQGIGSAALFGTGMAILTSVFPPEERGRVLGITLASVYVGLSAGPLLGGLIAEHFGWRGVFLFAVPLGVGSILLVITRLKGEWAEAKGESFDSGGSAIYSIALLALVFGLSRLPQASGFWLILLSLAGLGFFLWWETRQDAPVLNVDLFRRNRVFAFSNLAALINYSATFAVVFLLSLYLQYIQGLTPQNAGFVLVFQPLVMAVFSPFAGRLSDLVEPRVVASAGMALTTVGLGMLTVLNEATSLTFVIASLAVLGLGLALFSSPNTNAVMSSVERRDYGVASGTVGTMRLIGQMLSMGVAMMLLAIYVGRAQILPENHDAFLTATRAAFVISSVLCFAGIFASLARGKMRERAA